jgi:hypothetical protein
LALNYHKPVQQEGGERAVLWGGPLAIRSIRQTPMNAEKTEEQKARETRAACGSCGATLAVGPNYPAGVPIPRVVELWCPSCHTITLYNVERKNSPQAA